MNLLSRIRMLFDGADLSKLRNDHAHAAALTSEANAMQEVHDRLTALETKVDALIKPVASPVPLAAASPTQPL